MAHHPVVRAVPLDAAPGVVVVEGDQELRAVAADGRGQVAAQRRAALDDPVAMVVEEFDGVDAHERGTGPLFGLADRGALRGGEPVDPGLAAGDQEIADLAPGGGPFGDGGRGAVFEVVRVGDDGEGPLPVPGHGGEVGFGGHGALPSRPVAASTFLVRRLRAVPCRIRYADSDVFFERGPVSIVTCMGGLHPGGEKQWGGAGWGCGGLWSPISLDTRAELGFITSGEHLAQGCGRQRAVATLLLTVKLLGGARAFR